ncbi:MAG: coiled-coil domain-containing protein, partial [Solirubrobacteraceae bacterium]
MKPPTSPPIRMRYVIALLSLLATAAAPALAGQSQGALESGISTSSAREGVVGAGIRADSQRIAGFQGNISDLQTRLSALESSLTTERRLLDHLRLQLKAARSRLASLVTQLAHDRQVLIAQVVAAYESPPPSIVTVILDAHGFGDLIERVDDLKAIGEQNASATEHVIEVRAAVATETKRLAVLTSSHQRETTAVLVQRDEVASLHLALVNRQLRYVHSRERKSAELGE